MFDLTGRVAAVTGSSSGLGVSMAKALAGQGASIVLLARRKEKLEAVAEEIRSTYGVEVLPVPTDVTNEESVKAAAAAVKEKFGKVDILINNAGAGLTIPIDQMTLDEWEKDMKVDLTGVFLMTREFGKLMLEKEYGRIINIASMYGLVGNTALPSSSYHAAKGAVVNFTRATAAEWAKKGITCNSICPGYFGTELTEATLSSPEFTQYMQMTVPVGRYGKLPEIQPAAVFLASDEASYVAGAILPVDGGYTCV